MSLVFALTGLLNLLDERGPRENDVLAWASPIPLFGSLENARVATLGINPSNREFVTAAGVELEGAARRFHTLTSLGLNSWSELDTRQMDLLLESYQSYFRKNPYDVWFKPLNSVVEGTGFSYYDDSAHACHLDLVPFATASKWSELRMLQRSALLRLAAGTMGALLRDSSVDVLILNGSGVVREFESVNELALTREERPAWNLGGGNGRPIAGIAYSGLVDRIAGVDLGRQILVAGFNVNLQSSYGVTRSATRAIADWVGRIAKDWFE